MCKTSCNNMFALYANTPIRHFSAGKVFIHAQRLFSRNTYSKLINSLDLPGCYIYSESSILGLECQFRWCTRAQHLEAYLRHQRLNTVQNMHTTLPNCISTYITNRRQTDKILKHFTYHNFLK